MQADILKRFYAKTIKSERGIWLALKRFSKITYSLSYPTNREECVMRSLRNALVNIRLNREGREKSTFLVLSIF